MKIIRANPSVPEGKLALILDLDHTLLHAKLISDLSPAETYLLTDPKPPTTLFKWRSRLLKLRPSTQSFLKEASTLFDLHIYTMGNRCYAHGVSKFLDPDGIYFRNKIFSSEDCPHPGKKGLKNDERSAIVVDDTEEVWEDHSENLIHIERYYYFSCSTTSKAAYSELKTDEDEAGGALARVLDVLRRAHRMYFDNDFGCRDVRVVLKEMRQEILKGCRIVFSMEVLFLSSEGKSVSEMAEEVGATWCSIDGADASKTHVVSISGKSKTARWGLKKRKILVSPGWIEAAYYSWCRQKEEKFCLMIDNSL